MLRSEQLVGRAILLKYKLLKFVVYDYIIKIIVRNTL